MIASRQSAHFQFQIQDILALVVAYGMAALLFRAFWPSSRPSLALCLPAIALYLWLGLALSGPIILFRRRRQRIGPPVPFGQSVAIESFTWAECAWLLVGIYWILLGSIVIPARLNAFTFGDAFLFGLVPAVVALGLRMFRPKHSRGQDRAARWTNTAAIVLLMTWPVAWLCLIVLGRSLQ